MRTLGQSCLWTDPGALPVKERLSDIDMAYTLTLSLGKVIPGSAMNAVINKCLRLLPCNPFDICKNLHCPLARFRGSLPYNDGMVLWAAADGP